MGVNGNEDLIADYLGEAHDYLEQLNTILMELADGDGDWPEDRVNQLFRSAHSLKGLSACFGFETTNTVTHHLESLLSKVREGRIDPSTEVVREQPMPLVQLPETYRFADGVLSQDCEAKSQHAIVFGHQGNEVALGVDRLVGKEDLVIKPLCAELTGVPGLAGMAIRGDGKVTLILDPSGFADFAMSRQRLAYSKPDPQTEPEPQPEPAPA